MNSSLPIPPSAERSLILAAIQLFGRDGFAAVSTRMLSEQAGTNVSAIKYHFGSKDDLYKAAIKHVVAQLQPRFDFALTAFEQSRDLVGDDNVLQARLVTQIVENLMQVFLGSEDVPLFIPFVFREFFVPGPHFDYFYDALPRRLHELFTALVSMVEKLDPNSEEAIIRAHAVLGQIMFIHVGREILYRRLGWTEFKPKRIALIIHIIQDVVLQSLCLKDPDLEKNNG
jgi:AcrR family transcriptional regulator